MRLSAKAGERKIAAAVRQALADRALGDNARRLAEAIRKEIGADHAVAELEALGSGRDPSKKDSEPTRMEALP